MRDPLSIAALAAVISGAGACRPSLWFDEGATISASASRSLPQLWLLLSHIDAVHGLYYLLMHGWFMVFPPTEFWSRVPSCLAVGAAAAGTVVFTRQFSSRATAVCAGVIYALLPRTTWAGIEARSYALSGAAAVWLTVLLIAAVRRNRSWLWLAYALVLMLSVLVNLNLALLVLVYAAMLPVLRPGKSAVIWWAASSTVAIGAMTPFMIFAHGQIFQVGLDLSSQLAQRPRRRAAPVLREQCAVRDPRRPRHRRRLRVFRLGGAVGPGGDIRRLLLVCAAWMVLPTAVSVIYSAVSKPVYYPRYLFFTAPAMAAVLAVCLITVARKRWAVTCLLVVFAVAAAPNYLFSQRTRYAKEGWDYSQVADVVAAQANARRLPADRQHGFLGARPDPRAGGDSAGGFPPADRRRPGCPGSRPRRSVGRSCGGLAGHPAARQVRHPLDDLRPRQGPAEPSKRPFTGAGSRAGSRARLPVRR